LAGRQGLGEELALVFALHGARLILSARNTERLQARWPHQELTLTFWLNLRQGLKTRTGAVCTEYLHDCCL